MTEEEYKICIDFSIRRKNFNLYLHAVDLSQSIFTCPSCGFPTLSSRNSYEICDICNWEDDGQDDQNADKVLGGPNSELSLTMSRIKIGAELKILEENLNGRLITNPDRFFSIMENHKQRLKKVINEIGLYTDIRDPLYDKLKTTQNLIKHDLIEK